MSKFEREFNSAVESVEREVFINLVTDNPQLTLGELTQLANGKFAALLATVTIGDLIASSGQTVDPGAAEDGEVDTRTAEGRRAYDQAVLGVVQRAPIPVKAPDITSKVGGTALQVRKALARLIEQGRITWDGRARGTRYKAS